MTSWISLKSQQTHLRKLLVSLKNKAGRNTATVGTVRHQGGGHKRHYRLIDFRRIKDGVEAVVKRSGRSK